MLTAIFVLYLPSLLLHKLQESAIIQWLLNKVICNDNALGYVVYYPAKNCRYRKYYLKGCMNSHSVSFNVSSESASPSAVYLFLFLLLSLQNKAQLF